MLEVRKQCDPQDVWGELLREVRRDGETCLAPDLRGKGN